MAKRGKTLRTTKWNGRAKRRCQFVVKSDPIRHCPKRAEYYIKGKHYCRIHWRLAC